MEEEDLDERTKAVHGGRKIDQETKAVTPPIHLSTTFERAEDGSYPQGYIYSRNNNPNRESLERCLVELEGRGKAACFSSGSAAAMALFHTLSPGKHVLAPEDVYHGTEYQLTDLLKKWNLDVGFVDMTRPEEVEECIRDETSLVWMETPSNPMLKITDIERVSQIAQENDALAVVDNTWSTPVIQKPLEHGADMSVYSTTKYFGGHSDAVGGAVVCREDLDVFDEIRDRQIHEGATPSPFTCWLTMRGIRTLSLRMKAHSDNAMEIARYLDEQHMVETVHYPGLEDHPGHDLAQKQMDMYSGMLSFQVKGGKEEAMEVAADVDIFTRATSLGSVESLIEHRASIEGEDTRTPKDLLRLSVGIEDAGDLIDDLAGALDNLK